MTNWKDIHPDFTEELTQKWQDQGFTYEEVKEWIKVGFNVAEIGFCAWLRDKKTTSAQMVFNEEFSSLEKLRKEYNISLEEENNSLKRILSAKDQEISQLQNQINDKEQELVGLRQQTALYQNIKDKKNELEEIKLAVKEGNSELIEKLLEVNKEITELEIDQEKQNTSQTNINVSGRGQVFLNTNNSSSNSSTVSINVLAVAEQKILNLEQRLIQVEKEKNLFLQEEKVKHLEEKLKITEGFQKREKELLDALTLFKELQQRKEKIVQAYLQLAPEKELFQQLISSHLEYTKAKQQKLPIAKLRKDKERIYNELEGKTNEKTMKGIELVLTDCEELIRVEIELEAKVNLAKATEETKYQFSNLNNVFVGNQLGSNTDLSYNKERLIEFSKQETQAQQEFPPKSN